MSSALPHRTQAAVLFEIACPLRLIDVELPPLAAGQVLVEVAYSGVCHSQLNEVRGRKGPDRFLPHVMGHEGSGHVLAIGPGVTKVAPGDSVVLTWIKAGGAEAPGARYPSRQGFINSGAVATFMCHSIVSESRLVRAPAGIALREAALLGCAIPTGGGAVLHAEIEDGASVAVFGVGGVGMSAIAIAGLRKANPLIAVDVVERKLELARRLGATHGIDARSHDPIAQIRVLTEGRGVDLAIEAAGIPSAMEAAFAAVRPAGGLCVLAGNVAHGQKIALDPYDLIRGRRIRGTWGGETDPDVDLPRYAQLVLSGKLDLSAMISAEYPLAAINEAMADLESGAVSRALLALRPER